MMKQDSLPEGWKVVKLSEICKAILGGGTPSTSKPEYWDGPIPWISSADIYGLKDIQPRKSISEDAIKNSAASVLPKGGIIVVTRVGLGKIGIAPYDIAFSQDNQGLILNEDVILQSYALICLSRAVQSFKHQSRGTTINGVTKKQLVELTIPLPPIDEQKEIVEKIEELLSELDKGIESLETAQQQLKVYRQAVLKSAFEGRLTNEIVKDGELPGGWELKPLANVVERVFDGPFGSSLKSDDYTDHGVRVIRLENIGVLDFKDEFKTYVSNEKYLALAKHTVSAGDIIFSSFIIERIRVAILPPHITCAINKADCFCIRLGSDKIDKAFLAYFLATKNAYNQLIGEVHGATRPRVNTTQLKSCLIPTCSLDEQRSIVAEIESRLSVCDKMEETITTSLQQAQALRQSILKMAFEGRLVKKEDLQAVSD